MGALAGRMSMDEAVRQSKAETRQYIKRQSTWINGHMIAWKRLNTQSLKSSMASAIAFIQS
jgi:tRNA A37 N6-isopentenylltransferase MiaA